MTHLCPLYFHTSPSQSHFFCYKTNRSIETSCEDMLNYSHPINVLSSVTFPFNDIVFTDFIIILLLLRLYVSTNHLRQLAVYVFLFQPVHVSKTKVVFACQERFCLFKFTLWPLIPKLLSIFDFQMPESLTIVIWEREREKKTTHSLHRRTWNQSPFCYPVLITCKFHLGSPLATAPLGGLTYDDFPDWRIPDDRFNEAYMGL